MVRLSLPVKDKHGQISRRILTKSRKKKEKNVKPKQTHVPKEEHTYSSSNPQDAVKPVTVGPVSTLQLMASREEKLKFSQYKIGVLSSDILENPEAKSKNFLALLNFMDEKDPEILVAIRKLAAASLREIFIDLLPSYNLRSLEKNGVKFKKDVFQRQQQESSILNYYKQYLQRLEKMASNLKNRKRVSSSDEQDIHLGTFALDCMANLLVAQPDFNFSSNMINFLVPFLDNEHRDIRIVVANCFAKLFNGDICGELSLTVLRRLNQYFKVHVHPVHTEALSVLLHLRMIYPKSSVDQKDETKRQKAKQTYLRSKKERKKKAQLEHVRKEMLEMKAEVNENAKHKASLEISNLLSSIYFHILKNDPNNAVLAACFEGLAKFSQCLSLEACQSLLNVLNHLMMKDSLNLRAKLHCLHLISVLLFGQDTKLSIDSIRFYNYVYKNMYELHVGRNDDTMDVMMKILSQALLRRRSDVAQAILMAFVKRMHVTMLNLQHEDALRVNFVTKSMSKATSLLFDTHNGMGNDTYLPEMNDSPYCNAYCSRLWEMVALQRHYHANLRIVARNVMLSVRFGKESDAAHEILKSYSGDSQEQLGVQKGVFDPVIVVPKSAPSRLKKNIPLPDRIERLVGNTDCERSFENDFSGLFEELRRRI